MPVHTARLALFTLLTLLASPTLSAPPTDPPPRADRSGDAIHQPPCTAGPTWTALGDPRRAHTWRGLIADIGVTGGPDAIPCLIAALHAPAFADVMASHARPNRAVFAGLIFHATARAIGELMGRHDDPAADDAGLAFLLACSEERDWQVRAPAWAAPAATLGIRGCIEGLTRSRDPRARAALVERERAADAAHPRGAARYRGWTPVHRFDEAMSFPTADAYRRHREARFDGILVGCFGSQPAEE